MIREKEIQTIHTKQNITYPETRKLFESLTPTIGLSYAAATSTQNQKKYQSIATHTECSNNSNTQSIKSIIQPQTSHKKSSKQQKTAPEASNSAKSKTPKLPMHKQKTETASYKKNNP